MKMKQLMALAELVELDELPPLGTCTFGAEHWTSLPYAFQKLLQVKPQAHMLECQSQTSDKS
jgi:hypothetical protein